VIDTETTGVTAKDQVIQLAALQIQSKIKDLLDFNHTSDINSHRSIVNVHNTYFRPTVPIHPRAQEIHGLSRIKLLKATETSLDVRLPSTYTILIAHNAPFDLRLLSYTDKRINLEEKNTKYICTMGLAKKIEKIQGGVFGFTNYQLPTMLAHFYPDEALIRSKEQFHCALDDCRMCLLVLIKLLENFPFLNTIEEVQEFFFEEDRLKIVTRK
jgi:DNA polymerase III epsilon subunit-like protein